VREPIPGKSRALNRLVPLAKANVLAFLDDDVEVAPEWLRITWQFFRDYSYDVLQGSILIPPSMQNDQEFLRLLSRYRTICSYSKPGAEVRQIVSLNAANRPYEKNCLTSPGYSMNGSVLAPRAHRWVSSSGKGFCGPGDASVTSRAR